jgi:hypothetical protein
MLLSGEMMPRRAGLPRRTRGSLTVIAAAAVLTGCARGEQGSAGGAPTTPVVTSATSATTSAPAATTAAPTPASPPLTPPPTANGNLKACKGGRCQVKVTHPVDIQVDAKRFQVGTVSVRSIEDHQVSLVITLPTPANRLDCQSDEDCDSSVVGGSDKSPNKGYVTAHAGAVITANRLVIQVVSAGGGSAVLRLKPA